MNKSDIFKKRKWLKKRRREKKVRKQQNYLAKTHKGASKFDLQENIRVAREKEKEEKLKMKRMERMFK